jgi:hypothetical protein
MNRLNLKKGSFDLVVGGMQLIFLLIAAASIVVFVILDFSLTFRGFAYAWIFAYLFLITSSLRKQVQELPETKQRAILNWAVAAFVGITLATIFSSFIA